MSPRHLAERRALYAAIDASGDNHVRPRVPDPLICHSARSTCTLVGDILYCRDHRGVQWTLDSVGIEPAARLHAVPDCYGDLVRVPGLAADRYGNLVEVQP